MPTFKWQRRRMAREIAGLERGGELTVKGEREAEDLADAGYSPFEEPDDYGDHGYDPGDDRPS